MDNTPDVAAGNVVADLHRGPELPLLFAVEGVRGDTAGDVNALGDVGNGREWALDTVVDVVEQTGAELDRQGLARPQNGVADLDTG